MRPILLASSSLLVLLAACSETEPTAVPLEASAPRPHFSDAAAGAGEVHPLLAAMNEQLAARGVGLRVHHAELIAHPAYGALEGRTVYADDRSLRTHVRWVPGDPRRNARGTALTYLVDQSDGMTSNGSGFLSSAQTEAAIDRAMATWDQLTCADLSLPKVPDSGADPDVLDWYFSRDWSLFGNPFLADIVHAGWLPASFFDLIMSNGSRQFVAVAFFVDFGTDVNEDGYLDTALAEIYYNDAFPWGINTDYLPVDVETIALHEAGHALGQGHFGSIFHTQANGKLHVAPRAVMNSIYLGQQQTLLTTDLGGHCSIFGSWPQR